MSLFFTPIEPEEAGKKDREKLDCQCAVCFNENSSCIEQNA